MATRPVFVPSSTGFPLVGELDVEFEWHPGFSEKQKRKCIRSLHQAAKKQGIDRVLEISTKSGSELGGSLSAFNLEVSKREKGTGVRRKMTVESAYQGSKVFEEGGPYTDLYQKSALESKKDDRLRSSGGLVEFDLLGDRWPLKPRTAFYDWVYINALYQNRGRIEKIADYDGFTDIEFNPHKSINCQAHAAALAVALHRRGVLREVLKDKGRFIEVVKTGKDLPPPSHDYGDDFDHLPEKAQEGMQGDLFEGE